MSWAQPLLTLPTSQELRTQKVKPRKARMDFAFSFFPIRPCDKYLFLALLKTGYWTRQTYLTS